MASLAGDIPLMPVGDVFLWVANRHLSVVVTMHQGSVDRRFVVREGMVMQAACSDPREYLGQHLINFGYINEDQLQKAFDTQQETHVPLGRVLVMVDAISQEQLQRVLLFKTRESLLEAMCWREGTFKLSTDVSEDTELDTDVPVNLLEVHSEGLARSRMWEEIRSVFPTDGTRCEVLVDALPRASSFDRRLIELLKNGQSIGEASLELRAMDFQIYARLYDLYNRKVVQPRLTASPAKAPRATVPRPVTTPKAALPDDDEHFITPGLDEFDLDIGMPEDELEDADIVAELDQLGAVVDVPEPGRHRRRGGEYSVVRPERPVEAPGVVIPSEAEDPASALRIALAGRNWNEALILAERILQHDPVNAEAIAARRVAEAQVRKLEQKGVGVELDLGLVPGLALAREDIAVGHMTSKERYVLSRIDGKRTLAQIAAVSPIQKGELLRIVDGFRTRGFVQLR